MKQEELIQELKNLGNTFNLLVFVPPEKLQQNINEIMKFLTSTSGIYISLNKPYTSIKEELNKNGVKTNNIFFIDSIKASVSETKNVSNVLFVSNPGDLKGLSLAVGKLIDSKSQRFLVMDALRTLLIYNNVSTVYNFIKSIIDRSTSSKLKTIIFTTIKNEALFKKIKPLFDKTLEISE